ncbi:MAG TPA: SDR family NAD(P)-dependent oxidoreductase [Actinomycetota bacterium]
MTDAQAPPTTTARRTALVTGASSGFGELFAERFAADGFDVVLVARSAEPMERIAERIRSRSHVHATVIAHDLAEPDAAATLMSSLHAQELHVDALVNNAGFSTYGPFADADPGITSKMLMVNVVAMTELARACLPGMLERGWGRVVLLGSVGSFSAAPMTAAYAATKAYVLSLGLALHEELKGTGVTVTTLCPGPTATGFQTRASMADSALIRSGLDSAESVVDAGYAAMKKGTPYLVTGTTSRLFALGTRFIPRTVASKIAGNAQRRVS